MQIWEENNILCNEINAKIELCVKDSRNIDNLKKVVLFKVKNTHYAKTLNAKGLRVKVGRGNAMSTIAEQKLSYSQLNFSSD